MIDLTGYRHIAVAPVTRSIGAEIAGVDAAAPVAPEVAEELSRALGQFTVLFMRGQTLDGDALVRFAASFGAIGGSPLGGRDANAPAYSRLVREADAPLDARNFGDRWHMDRAGDAMPPKGFLLACEEAPPYAGDTLFASLAAAYDALPPELQHRCAGLTGVHSMSGLFDMTGGGGAHRWSPGGGKRPLLWSDRAMIDHVAREAEHPLVCRHPQTGRPYLFASGAYLLRIKELGAAESAELVDQLDRHVHQPEFTCRWRWRAGDVAILENRAAQHYAVNDTAGFARRMLRVELAGDWRPERYAPDAARAA